MKRWRLAGRGWSLHVALRRSAWIETSDTRFGRSCFDRSHSAGVRGLKLEILGHKEVADQSHSAGVRGLKHYEFRGEQLGLECRTPQECVD